MAENQTFVSRFRESLVIFWSGYDLDTMVILAEGIEMDRRNCMLRIDDRIDRNFVSLNHMKKSPATSPTGRGLALSQSVNAA